MSLCFPFYILILRAALVIIKKVNAALTIPVIANGGVECAADALQLLRASGCAAVMSSEALLENPALFSPAALAAAQSAAAALTAAALDTAAIAAAAAPIAPGGGGGGNGGGGG